MPVIKIYLEDEEYAPVARLAEQLHVKPQDVAYTGLNRLMLEAKTEELRSDIENTTLWRKDNLPRWGDSARSVHAYEGKADEHTEPMQ